MTISNENFIENIRSLENKAQKTIGDLRNPLYKTMIEQELISLIENSRELRDDPIKGYKGTIPYKGDNRYCKFPNKPLIDDLRVELYEKYESKDLTITYLNVQEAFNNDFHLYAQTYMIRSKIKYTIMFEQLYDFSKPDLKPSIIVRLPLTSLFDTDAGILINILVYFIQEHTGSPVNFIYTDRELSEVSFARIGNGTFRQNTMGYYNFFYNFYDSYDDSWLKNVIYIGSKMKECTSQEEIVRVNNEFLLPYSIRIANELGIANETLNSFNEIVKERILKK